MAHCDLRTLICFEMSASRYHQLSRKLFMTKRVLDLSALMRVKDACE